MRENLIKASSTRIQIFFNRQLFLSGYGFRLHVSGESGIRVLSPEWKYLNTLWSGNVWTLNPNILLTTDVTRSSFFTMNIQDGAEQLACSKRSDSRARVLGITIVNWVEWLWNPSDSFVICFCGPESAQRSKEFLSFWLYWPIKTLH